MKPRSAKAKGMKFQREVKDKVCQALDIHPEDIVPTTAGVVGVDLRLSRAARDKFPFSVECKHLAKFSIYKIYDQAAANTLEGTVPMAVIKQNRSTPLAVLKLDDLLEVIAKKQ